MSFSLEKGVCRVLFHGRRSSGENLLGGVLPDTLEKNFPLDARKNYQKA
jgi:hypothetical protein